MVPTVLHEERCTKYMFCHRLNLFYPSLKTTSSIKCRLYSILLTAASPDDSGDISTEDEGGPIAIYGVKTVFFAVDTAQSRTSTFSLTALKTVFVCLVVLQAASRGEV